jgi:ribosomal protein S6
MRLTERNNAYETVNIVDPGQPEERQPSHLEQQRQVVVSPHGT